jgi:hypothetical protein
MSFLRNMDLYKAIVLMSVVLLPVGGWLIKDLDNTIAASQKAIIEATRTGGLLEKIGGLQKKVEVVVANRTSTSEAIREPRQYFDGQILAAGGSSLKPTDFGVNPPREETTTLSRTQRVTDHVVDITWHRKDPVQMDFIYAVLFNCESGARAVGAQVQQSVWKLRELHIVNATDDKSFAGYKTPPPQLEDRWSIKQLKFARREPRKGP